MGQRSPANTAHNLGGVPLLACLNPDELAGLERQCRWIEFGPGEKIIERGEEYSSVYFLISGTAHVLNYSESGRAVSYAALKDGDVFGELAAIDGLPRSAWVCTITRCTVGAVPGPTFLDLVTGNPDLAMALLKRLAAVIRLGDERLADVSLLGAEQRVCMELIRMAEPDPNDPRRYLVFPVPTQTNFANMIGASRETVSRILGRLRDDDIVVRTDRGLAIPDRARLEQRALM
ncbi:MAG: Crp/Fnr family transcriptional regulator [Rhodospirillales bacterium CG15_BIG_FIL_POST_REV_8_21_14_020_66_15]|nr:MAG: Crp/Fnr family transcriptional regulator [Rhodospirillales bacterium CG15_BIG_FIL_POST_REV_8_21_14_020_66_15]